MAKLKFQRGDTFSLAGPLDPVVAGVPVPDITGWTGSSQVRNAATGALIAELTFTVLDAAARTVRVHFDGSTADWPVARARVNLRLVSPTGAVASTEPDEFEIVRANTLEPAP